MASQSEAAVGQNTPQAQKHVLGDFIFHRDIGIERTIEHFGTRVRNFLAHICMTRSLKAGVRRRHQGHPEIKMHER